MIKIKSIYDIFSLIPLFIEIYSLLSFNFRLIFLLFVSVFIHYLIKYSTKDIYPSIFKRPDKACDCNMYNSGGKVSNRPGFPSGHMTAISVVMNYYLLKKQNLTKFDVIIYNIPCLLVAIGRYYKNCHNIVQIIAGYLLGLVIAFINSKLD
jgi:membrane-associated phospholipid phosphatase